ncbi:TPA: hypothetical protein SIC70_002147 [Pasteurella multocida]|uniref:hypothetical protein n=1 Tax=Pasteurella multocida TaxID=747 RepID=UPI0029B37E65|nr:hypothetical protein [Pasteurella multocida]MEB4587002.1 hypothetical protein [Pasteurella multocida]HEH9717242.1 hypothetical protein [Pasteurella multocida]HEH9728184.1 hypothetical protein [Pasteurella multocida]HEH9735311.1 hypothetical protein [Pasteurella multocida]HEH9766918.1 hypothetical protein [Pasteurella multocida]
MFIHFIGENGSFILNINQIITIKREKKLKGETIFHLADRSTCEIVLSDDEFKQCLEKINLLTQNCK